MNRYDADLMDKPSIHSELCPFCGRMATNAHHIVYRSRGGKDGPTVDVCGSGTEGCHWLFHSHRLHLRWDGGWMYLRTDEPVKQDKALGMEGWRNVIRY